MARLVRRFGVRFVWCLGGLHVAEVRVVSEVFEVEWVQMGAVT